jgi:hypothetical protein
MQDRSPIDQIAFYPNLLISSMKRLCRCIRFVNEIGLGVTAVVKSVSRLVLALLFPEKVFASKPHPEILSHSHRVKT